MILMEDILLQQEDWPHVSSNDAYAVSVARNVSISAVDPDTILNFNFLSDAAVLDPGVTVTFEDMSVENARRGPGVSLDFFVGAENTTVILVNVTRWRYVCTSAADAVKVHLSYPRPKGYPGLQQVAIAAGLCWRGQCYSEGILHYRDFVTLVAPPMSESTAYLPGYILILRNMTRLCASLVPDSCLRTEPRDQCLAEYTEAYIKSLYGDGRTKSRVALAAALGAVGGFLLVAGAGAGAAWRRRRRRQAERAAADEELGKVFGPLEDMVVSNKQHGWRVTHHVRGPAAGPGSGGRGAGVSSPGLTDRLELGVLLGAGSFGRVYRGRWQGADVAVKVMQHDARTAHRIANEVELMMMMQHCNILKAYDVLTWTHTSESASTDARNKRASGSAPEVPSRDSITNNNAQLGHAAPRQQHQQQQPHCAAQRQAPSSTRLLSQDGAMERSASTNAAAAAGNASGAQLRPAAPRGGGGAAAAAVDRVVSGPLPGRTASECSSQAASGQLLPSPSPLVSGSNAGGGGGGGGSGGGGACGAGSPRVSSGGSAGGGGAGGAGAAAADGAHHNNARGARPAMNYVPMGKLASGEATPLVSDELCAPSSAPSAAPTGSGGEAAGQLPGGQALGSPALEYPTAGSDDYGSAGPDADAQTWLIVEYCDGGTLADAVRNGKLGQPGEPDMARVLVRLRDVASGMAYLHSRNVLHGDLKAANVLLSSSNAAPFGMVAKVADFGLSRMLKVGQTHRSTRTVGTVTHMPPELLRLGKLSPAGDVYAFGIIMWEVFTGRVAFNKQHYGEVFERVVLRDERPPVPESMPEAYVLLMTRCWQADPMQRPGFDTVLRLINLMIDDMTAADVTAEGFLEAPWPPGSGGWASGGGVSGGGGGNAPGSPVVSWGPGGSRGVSGGSSAAGALPPGVSRHGAHLIQDL